MIVGIDIGRNASGVACPLLGLPENLKQYLKYPRIPLFKIKADHQSLDKLLALNPKGIVMEPTGGWYSQFWARFGEVYSIPVYWCPHAELKAQRGHFGFPNKYDDNDALCLAASYYDPYFVDQWGRKRFLSGHQLKAIQPLRELVFEWYQLDKLIGGLTAQLKLRLSYEFPEMSMTKWDKGVDGLTPSVGWLAGVRKNRIRDNQLEHSVANRLGIDITEYTIDHAQLTYGLELRQLAIEESLLQLIASEPLRDYAKALTPFGFSPHLLGLIIYKIFPFEKFLVNGKPWTERINREGKTESKRNISLSQFQAYFGLSRRVEQSGLTEKIKWSGSKLLRAKLYAWALSRVCARKSRIKSEIGEKLGNKWDDMKAKGTANGKDAITRLNFMTTRLMFQRLTKELVK